MKPIAHWSDNDTSDLILFDDGSIYVFDEKGAATVDAEGNILNTYWRGDDEPFDVRQTLVHDVFDANGDPILCVYTTEQFAEMAGPVRAMTEAMGSWSYELIHYSDRERTENAARQLVRAVKEAK